MRLSSELKSELSLVSLSVFPSTSRSTCFYFAQPLCFSPNLSPSLNLSLSLSTTVLNLSRSLSTSRSLALSQRLALFLSLSPSFSISLFFFLSLPPSADAGHARSHIEALDFSTVDGVVTVSGDGLLFEVCQAFRLRSKDIPPSFSFGIVAAGSGNGLASSLNFSNGRPLASPIDNALAVCKGRTQPLDLATYETECGKKYLGFLSLTWGIVADVDLESDVLRALGSMRFDVYGLWRIMALRKYTAK